MPIPLTPSNLALVSRRSNQLSKIRFSVLGSRFIGDGAICFAPILPIVTRVTSYILSSIRSIGRIEERFDGYSKVISLESLETEGGGGECTRSSDNTGFRSNRREIRRSKGGGETNEDTGEDKGVDKNKRALFFNDREARPLKSCLLAECSRHCPNYSRIPREPLSLLLSVLLFNLSQSLCRTSSRSPTRISCQLFLSSSSNRTGIKLLRTKGMNNPVE